MEEFERELARRSGASNAVVVNSGTSAMLLIALGLRSMGVLRDRQMPTMVCPAVTWPTTFTPWLHLGGSVHLVDVDERTLGMSPQALAQAIEEVDVAVVNVTHLLGFNALTDELLDVIDQVGAILVEDACEALAAEEGERWVGTTGLFGGLSFYFGHHMSTIEGGAVLVRDRDLVPLLRRMRSHGLTREGFTFDDDRRHDGSFQFSEAGLNLRTTEVSAVLGLSGLRRIEAERDHRRSLLDAAIQAAPNWMMTGYATRGANPFALPVIADSKDRRERAEKLAHDMGIETRPVVGGNLYRQPFVGTEAISAGPLPVADQIHEAGFYVGAGAHVTVDMVGEFMEALESI